MVETFRRSEATMVTTEHQKGPKMGKNRIIRRIRHNNEYEIATKKITQPLVVMVETFIMSGSN